KGGGQFEAGHELPQLGGVFRQLTDRLGGGLGTQGGLRGDVLNDIHRRRDLGGGGGLVARRGGDVLNQFRQGGGYVLDFAEGAARIVGQLGALDHLGGGLLHGGHRFV